MSADSTSRLMRSGVGPSTVSPSTVAFSDGQTNAQQPRPGGARELCSKGRGLGCASVMPSDLEVSYGLPSVQGSHKDREFHLRFSFFNMEGAKP